MAIINEKKVESNSGFEKELDASAMSMIIDNLQIHLYNKPIQSCIKETVSNALDSVKEKAIATSILRNESKISDFYVEKEGDIYKSSKFDVDYYDLKYFSDLNSVDITYITSYDSLTRDQIIIEDHGVGLGDKRLFGFFTIGYSSKRLSNRFLGAFGLGCKSPLATGIESYTLVSNHNGKQFKFEVFSQKLDSSYSRWNEDGTENNFITHIGKDGKEYHAYYLNTTEKNGVKIIFDVKKIHKAEFFRAIRSQLQYINEIINFKEIQLDYEGNAYRTNIINIKNEIIFEDDNIILGKDDYYTKPHFVINNVVYNIIDFPELELPERSGNIGIKVKMEEVDLPPSRESVIYTSRTKGVVLKKMKLVSEIALNYINNKIKSDGIEFETWNDRYLDMVSNKNSIIHRLNSLIDDGKSGAIYDGILFKKNDSSAYGKFVTIAIPNVNYRKEINNQITSGLINLTGKKFYAVHQNMMSNNALGVISHLINKSRGDSRAIYLNNNVSIIKNIIESNNLSFTDNFVEDNLNDVKEILSDIFDDIYNNVITTKEELNTRLSLMDDVYNIFFNDIYKYLLIMNVSGIIKADKDYINNAASTVGVTDEITPIVPKVRSKSVSGQFNAEFVQRAAFTSNARWRYITLKFQRVNIGTTAIPDNVYYAEEGNLFHEHILDALKSEDDGNFFRSQLSERELPECKNLCVINGNFIARLSKSRIKWVSNKWTSIDRLFFNFDQNKIILSSVGARSLYKHIIENTLASTLIEDICVTSAKIYDDDIRRSFSAILELNDYVNVLDNRLSDLYKHNTLFNQIIDLYDKKIDHINYGSSKIIEIEHPDPEIESKITCVVEYHARFRVLLSQLNLTGKILPEVKTAFIDTVVELVKNTTELKNYYKWTTEKTVVTVENEI